MTQETKHEKDPTNTWEENKIHFFIEYCRDFHFSDEQLRYWLQQIIDQAIQQERENIFKDIKTKLHERIMQYDTKDGYSTLHNEVIEHIIDDLDHNVFTLISK